jgi:hypothetical protein
VSGGCAGWFRFTGMFFDTFPNEGTIRGFVYESGNWPGVVRGMDICVFMFFSGERAGR